MKLNFESSATSAMSMLTGAVKSTIYISQAWTSLKRRVPKRERAQFCCWSSISKIRNLHSTTTQASRSSWHQGVLSLQVCVELVQVLSDVNQEGRQVTDARSVLELGEVVALFSQERRKCISEEKHSQFPRLSQRTSQNWARSTNSASATSRSCQNWW